MRSQRRRDGDLNTEGIGLSMELYLCRHGETEWTVSGKHTGKTDLPLTAEGERQAAALRERLRGIHIDAVFTSPRKRAKSTCEGMHAVADPLLVEWDYGDYEGLTSAEIGPAWDLFTQGAPGGETPLQVAGRADQFLKTVSRYKGKVAIFSHGHFLRMLAARFLGLAPEMGNLFVLSVASLSILGFEKGRPAIILWNDARIFSKGAENPTPERGSRRT